MSMQPQIASPTLRDIAAIALVKPGLAAPSAAAAPAAAGAPAGRCPFGHGAGAEPKHPDRAADNLAAPAVSPAISGLHAALITPTPLPEAGLLPGMSHPTFVDRLLLVGMTHRKGDALWLERMAVPSDELPGVLRAVRSQPGIEQTLILSTCNRTELYAVLDHHAQPQAVFIAMNRARAAWGDVPAEQLDIKKGWAAVEHLFAVASGLEAMVLGETEITAQVKNALDLAEQVQAAGGELVSMVQQALRATKKVRNNTRVSSGTISVGSAAAQLALVAHQAHAAKAPIVVIGAGAIGEQVVRALSRADCTQFIVVNRSLAKAQALAERYGGVAAPIEDLYPALARSSAVVAAVSVNEPIVVAEHFDSHSQHDGHYTFIDLCIPRAIDHRLGEHPRRQLFGLPAVRKHLDEHIALRTLDEPLARQIVAEEVRRYRGRVLQQFLVPLIKQMQERAESITQARLSRYTADGGAPAAIEKWANGLKGELLDMFLTSMREAMTRGACPLADRDEPGGAAPDIGAGA
ncbi:MAG: glutamyl-tRNA reductase [Planctomycetota bacterium]